MKKVILVVEDPRPDEIVDAVKDAIDMALEGGMELNIVFYRDPVELLSCSSNGKSEEAVKRILKEAMETASARLIVVGESLAVRGITCIDPKPSSIVGSLREVLDILDDAIVVKLGSTCPHGVRV